jgi:D-alanyl-lipoteichoic acid acyltransferase DltB (MBOAT superfamily)
VLVTGSLLYYATWGWPLVPILVGVSLATFELGPRVRHGPRRRLWLAAGVLLNLSALLGLKYVPLLWPGAGNWLATLSQAGGLLAARVFVALGVSYYTLQGISYLVDVHQGALEPSRSRLQFVLYMVYFPRLVSGPIERAREFLPQLSHDRQVDQAAIGRSVSLIALGVMRKVVIADPLRALIPPDLLQPPLAAQGGVLWVWLAALVFSIYNDFAGYTDIVRGVSGLFGIELSRNFEQPLLSWNFTQFWNRWHISLGHWLRDYIYYPLTRALLRRGRNPRRAAVVVAPALAAMLASAAWHQLSGPVLVWGAINGAYLVVERALTLRTGTGARAASPLWLRALGVPLVWALALVAAVPFISGQVWPVEAWHALIPPPYDAGVDVRPLLFMAIGLGLDLWQRAAGAELFFLRWPAWARAAGLVLVLAGSLYFAAFDWQPAFVYQGF